MLSRKLLVSAIAALVSAPMLVSADSDIGIGPAGTNAQANLAFRIVIPEFVLFSIGTPTPGTVDRVDFDLLAAGTPSGAGGLPLVANDGTGDGDDGILAVQLSTNVSSVSIDATGGNLTSGPNTIPFTQINGTAVGPVIPIPAFNSSLNFSTGLPGTLNDTWSYTYNNNIVFPPGQYDGTVTYTVTAL
jgi:hypothetical protein